MDQQYWHTKWKQHELGFNQISPNVLLQKFLPHFGLQTGAKIFVPLCGKTIDMIWLSQQGYEVIGVELSPIACEAFCNDYDLQPIVSQTGALVRYHSPNKKITLFCGDFFAFKKEQLGQIDLIYDRAALIALPTETRRHYATHLSYLMDLETQTLLITTQFDQTQMQGPPFSVGEQEIRNLYPSPFTIQQLYDKPIQCIAEHLQSKGLARAHEQAYAIKQT